MLIMITYVSDCISWNHSSFINSNSWVSFMTCVKLIPSYVNSVVKCIGSVYQRGSCRAIHLGLDLFGLFQKTAKLGDGYDDRNSRDKPFSFTEKETFSGVNILTASEVCMDTGILCSFHARHLSKLLNPLSTYKFSLIVWLRRIVFKNRMNQWGLVAPPSAGKHARPSSFGL